jgi:hypothetical protein
VVVRRCRQLHSIVFAVAFTVGDSFPWLSFLGVDATMHSFSCKLGGLRCGQYKREGRARTKVGIHPEATAMCLNDRTADEKPHSHAVRFCRIERFEEAVDIVGFESASEVRYLN